MNAIKKIFKKLIKKIYNPDNKKKEIKHLLMNKLLITKSRLNQNKKVVWSGKDNNKLIYKNHIKSNQNIKKKLSRTKN